MDNGKSGSWFQNETPLSSKGGQRENVVVDPYTPHVTQSPLSKVAEASVEIGDLTPMCTTVMPFAHANEKESA